MKCFSVLFFVQKSFFFEILWNRDSQREGGRATLEMESRKDTWREIKALKCGL